MLASILILSRSAASLPSDQDLERMYSSASQMEAVGNGSARDAILQEIRTAVRVRAAADSSVSSAMEFLDRIDTLLEAQEKKKGVLLRELQTLIAKGDTTLAKKRYESLSQRYPGSAFPSLRSLIARFSPASPSEPAKSAVVDSCAISPTGCASPAADSSRRDTLGAATCPSGPPQVLFLQPASPSGSINATDSAILLTMRITAPCPLGRIELRRDSLLVRSFHLPDGKSGVFDLDDAILVPSGSTEISLVACDTFGTCRKSSIKLNPRHTIPPWIPWASGGIVILGLLTGIIALFRRPGPAPKAGARGVLVRSNMTRPSIPTGSPVDIIQLLRQIIADAEKNLPRGPRLVSRLNGVPSVDGNATDLEQALNSLLQLPVARAGLRGTVLVATGRGPVSMEVVLEDNGPDLEDTALRTLFDPSSAKLRERQGADKDLLTAADIIMRHHGHLAAEPRIDGGLRLRIRLPLPSANGPRTTSLLK